MAQDKINKTDTPPAATLATSATQVIEFSEAVRRSKKLINSRLREDLVSLNSGKDNTTMVGISMMRKRPGELMAWAAFDALGFDALQLSVAHKIERGEKLPPDATVWLVQYLRGEVFRPKARAGRKTEDWLHQCIYRAVYSRVTLDGMTATRNDASKPTSACDAVAEALAELGEEPATFHGVKRVWQNMKKHVIQGISAT